MIEPLVGRAIVHDDSAALAREGAEELARLAMEAVQERGVFNLALTGGSSPGELFGALAREPVASRVPWENVHLFWGDDRVVPPAHPRSNFRLARRAFIDAVPLPPRNVHRVRGELGSTKAVREYAAELSDHLGEDPRFDLVHLGLGDDGHVASLFPFDRERLLERREPVLRALFRELGEWRITLVFSVLNASRRVEFLLPAPAKARIVRAAMRGPIDPLRIPAQGVRPAQGELVWRLSRALADALAREKSRA